MVRTVIGGLVGGFALFVVQFLFWGTPLRSIAVVGLDDARSASLQASLAQTLGPSGTGTYIVPDYTTQPGTVLYGQGPIAAVHFNAGGFAASDPAVWIKLLILALVTGLLIAFALRLADRVPNFADRARIAILFALAATLLIDLGQPMLNHFGWGYFVYAFFADFIALALAGVIVARWFGPATDVAPIAATDRTQVH